VCKSVVGGSAGVNFKLYELEFDRRGIKDIFIERK
jgi:hypothetical protein